MAEAGPSPSRIAEVREQVARVADCTAAADLEVMRERADGTDWQELATARGTTPECFRKRIEAYASGFGKRWRSEPSPGYSSFRVLSAGCW